VGPEVVGEVARVGHDEDLARLASSLTPRAERCERSRVEGPRSRVVGLVLVQADHPPGKVEVGPLEAERLSRAHALPSEEAVEHAMG